MFSTFSKKTKFVFRNNSTHFSSNVSPFPNFKDDEKLLKESYYFGDLSKPNTKKPFYNSESMDILEENVKRLWEIKKANAPKKQSIKKYDYNYKGRYYASRERELGNITKNDELENNETEFQHLRTEFVDRVEGMGINAKAFHDSEMRYEALKRAYLRYRRKRKYQQLLNLGITNRRPRRVTRQQYEHFKSFLQTKKYSYGRKPGPTYIPTRHGLLLRADIYEEKTGCHQKMERLALYHNLPKMVEQPPDALSVDELMQIDNFTAEQLGSLLRGKQFESWEKKLEWIYSIMFRLERSVEAYEGLKMNAELRMRVLKDYREGRDFKEYSRLRQEEKYKNLFRKESDEWEENALKGMVLMATRRMEKLDEKRLMVKAEIDRQPFIAMDKTVAKLIPKMMREREKDSDDLSFMKINPIMQRLVVNSNSLQRKQRILANPDLFLRFEPSFWHYIEKDVMVKVNRREEIEREVKGKLGEETAGAHNFLLKEVEDAGNKKQKEQDQFKEFRIFTRADSIRMQLANWATGILNGIKPKANKLNNSYMARQVQEFSFLLKDPKAADLVLETFPYDQVDLEPSIEEMDYLHAEHNIDQRFATQVVRWFLSPNLDRNVGHGYNPFRFWTPPVNKEVAFGWPELKDADELELNMPMDEYNTTSFVTAFRRVAHSQKNGVEHRTKFIAIKGNNKGLIGFEEKGFKVEAEDEEGEKTSVAARNFIGVPLYRGRALYHHTSATWKGSTVRILATPVGYGLVGSPTLRAILRVAGIRDATIMQFGSKNKVNLIKACFIALGKLTDLEEVARTRGRRIEDVAGEVDGQCYHLPRGFKQENYKKAYKYIQDMAKDLLPTENARAKLVDKKRHSKDETEASGGEDNLLSFKDEESQDNAEKEAEKSQDEAMDPEVSEDEMRAAMLSRDDPQEQRIEEMNEIDILTKLRGDGDEGEGEGFRGQSEDEERHWEKMDQLREEEDIMNRK